MESTEDATNTRNGSQSIHRVFALLRAVTEAGPEGIKLAELATATELHTATAHRMLAALQRERAVSYDPYARVYHIGYDFISPIEENRDRRLRLHFLPMMRRLAEVTDDVVYLYTRHGLNALCLDCVQGSFSTRSFTLGPGGRRPLGVGAGSLVLLASLSPAEIAATLNANAERYSKYTGLAVRQVMAMLHNYRRDGYSFNPGYVVPGVCNVGLPLYDDTGSVIAALGVCAEFERLTSPRLQHVARAMREEVTRAGPYRADPPHH